MLSDLNKTQRHLADYMSSLSEEAYYAGWMQGLEYALWQAVINGPTKYGRLSITENHINELRRLSDGCGGWIIFDEDNEETWIPMAQWSTKYNE